MLIREITESDLKGLLKLYTYLHDNPVPAESDSLSELWNQIISDKNHHIIVAEDDYVSMAQSGLYHYENVTL